MSKENENWLEAVYTAKTEAELEKGYDDWAEAYDQDLMRYGYRLPLLSAGLVARHVRDLNGPILDAGCGTGLIGENLQALSYGHLEGLDLSEQMLAVAKSKGAYKALYKMRLGDPLKLPDAHYSAVVSMGTFTVGHAGPEGFDELVRITRPNGHLIISIRTDINPNNPHLNRLNEIETEGRLKRVETSREIVTMPWEDASVRNTVYVFSRTA